jgi:hypothetical protein
MSVPPMRVAGPLRYGSGRLSIRAFSAALVFAESPETLHRPHRGIAALANSETPLQRIV